MNSQYPLPIDILMVDDSEDDFELTQIALLEARICNQLHRARDGEEGLAFLRGEKGFEGRPFPDLILLDLNMPRMDGREMLRELETDPALRGIPVAILTASSHEEDISESYDRNASCYLVKPVDFFQIMELTRQLGEFWFALVRRPAGMEESLEFEGGVGRVVAYGGRDDASP